MTRDITAAAQSALETDLGTEIITVIEIFWASTDGTATGPSSFYADREIESGRVKGAVVQMSEIDEIVQVTGGGQAASFNVELDDTDGALKTIFDANDIHKVPVRVWLYVNGTDFDVDKVPIFQGQINSPVVWSEGQRILSFSVVNRIEDVEVGFSAEEGEFTTLPEELIGRTWPLCFGTTINVPALKAIPAVSGKLAQGVGISDFTLPARIQLAEAITCPTQPIGFKCNSRAGAGTYTAECNIAFEEDQGCLQARCVEIERLKLTLEEQQAYEYSSLTIFGGEEFPQGRTITLNINGGLFTGKFNGTPANPVNVFTVTKRQHPDFDPATGGIIKETFQTEIESRCPGEDFESQALDSDFADTAFGPVFSGVRSSRLSWEAYREADAANFFWAGGGSTVTLETAKEIVYIANIVPSTILRVAAWRTLNGNRFLLTVPDKYFTIRQVNYNGYQVMEVVFQRPLSSEDLDSGGGWSDQIFITQVSTVGPNTVDIIEWLIDTYTDYAKDAASFAAVKTALEPYPMNFALLTRPNIISILQDLAQKARCALYQKLDTFYLKYLSEEPTPVATIEESDVIADDEGFGSLEITLTETEDLVTKLTSRWRRDYSLDDDYTLILRHNVKKYGTHAREEDYFPYGHLQLVRKSATFWLIRWANTWKRVIVSVPLEFLKLEPFDAVTLDLPDVAPSPFVAVVEKATLNTDTKQIDLELWTPIRAGETTPYNFAWPAQIAEHAIFPTKEARNAGQAGSGTDPNFTTIAPPGHPLRVTDPGVVNGFSLGCNGEGVTSLEPGRCRQDHGDGQPSDIGDTAPSVDVTSDTTGGVADGTKPVTRGEGSQYGGAQWVNNQHAKKAEDDAGKGREYSTVNDSNNTGDGHGTGDQGFEQDIDDEYLDNLPDPDDVDGCVIVVEAAGFKTSPSGIICLPSHPGERVEYYAFDNEEAALEFCQNFTDGSGCGSPPCTYCKTRCGIDSRSGECDSEGEGDQGLVGFRRDPNFPTGSFMGGGL